MTAENKRETADVLIERPIWIRIGILPFRMLPLTLGQIYEMGEWVEKMNGDEIPKDSSIQLISEMFTKYENAPLLQEVFLMCLFRSQVMRWLFRRYIKHRLTPRHINLMIQNIAKTYSANFFLTSIIFLRQTKGMTEPS